MGHIGSTDIQYDSLALIPLGGQSELGQMLWILTYAGKIVLIDAGAAYPSQSLPGVDLLLPSTVFLEANQEKIEALVLTNGHEEHSGAVSYLQNHLDIPRILAPRFVSQLLTQSVVGTKDSRDARSVSDVIETVETGQTYEVGPFSIEWLPVNNAIADATGLAIGTPAGTVVYTSSFKLDQTPVDQRFLDIGGFARTGDQGVTLLISDSAGVEYTGYTPSENSIRQKLSESVSEASGRIFIVFPGTNTHRLQILFDIARESGRRVILSGESLLKTALAAVVTGNLTYDRSLEAQLEDLDNLDDEEVMVVLSGIEDDPLNVLNNLAFGNFEEWQSKEGDTVIYSAHVMPGKLRFLANILDQLLSCGVKAVYGYKQGFHVSKHASAEELKLMLSMVKPRYFLPTMGEGRHIMHHAQLAIEWGMDPDSVFPLSNGDILEIKNGLADVIGSIEAEAVLFNREQGERVSTVSVKERRMLSLEGIVTISLVVNEKFQLISGPTIDAGASGFLRSDEWQEAVSSLSEAIKETTARFQNEDDTELGAYRAAVRELANKSLRGRLHAKPTVQVVVHQVATSRPQS